MKKLAFLMQKLRITEKKMGELISVDKSLVNKWKNGKRLLLPDSPYIVDIADACAEVFEGFDREEKTNFKNEFPFPFDITKAKPYFLSFLKNNAITDRDLSEIADTETAVDSIVCGDTLSCKENYLIFIKKIENKRKGTLFCYLSGLCNYNCNNMLIMLHDIFNEAIEKDNTIEVIFESFGEDAELKPILHFADFFYNRRFKLYVKRNKDPQKYYQSFFLYNKDIVLETNSIKGEDRFYSEIFADTVRCEFTHARFISELADCTLFFDKLSKKSHHSVFSLFQEHSTKTSPCCLYLGSPLFIEIPFELIKEALSYSRIGEETAEIIARRFMNVYQIIAKRTNSQKIYMMFSMESFEKLFFEENYYIFLLSMFCNENITVPRKAYKRMLHAWADEISKRDDIEIMLTPKDLTHNAISCYVKKYYFTTMWQNIAGAKEVLFTEDSYNTQLLYSVVKEEWDTSKIAIKDKNEVLSYIRGIADRLS